MVVCFRIDNEMKSWPFAQNCIGLHQKICERTDSFLETTAEANLFQPSRNFTVKVSLLSRLIVWVTVFPLPLPIRWKDVDSYCGLKDQVISLTTLLKKPQTTVDETSKFNIIFNIARSQSERGTTTNTGCESLPTRINFSSSTHQYQKLMIILTLDIFFHYKI